MEAEAFRILLPFRWADNDGSGAFTQHQNVTDGVGHFLQGVTVSRLTAAGPEQVVLSRPYAAAGMQTLTIPADATGTTWPWQELYPESQGEEVNAADIRLHRR